MATSTLKNRRRQDIDRTRGRRDDTLEELTYKIDVPARIRDKVHDAKEDVQVKAEEVKQHGQSKAEEVKQQVQAKAEEVEQQVQAKAEEVEQQVQATAEEVEQQVQATAEEVEQQVHNGAEALEATADGVAQQADHLTHQVLAELPSPAAEHIEPLMYPAKQRPLLIAAVTMGALLVMLVLRHLLRRSR